MTLNAKRVRGRPAGTLFDLGSIRPRNGGRPGARMTTFLRGKRLFSLRRTSAAMQSYRCSSQTSGKQRVNGVDLYYERNGAGEHAVLLLPGALGNTKTDFQPQLKALNADLFTVVGWDPRGYGQSRPPHRDFPLDFFERDARDAVDLMRTLGFVKFSLLGWSDGGITALIAAARNPEFIDKMVVWGANAFVSPQDLDIYNAVRDVSKWSAGMRAPMEAVYGARLFAQTWEAWVDGIAQFVHRPEGNICIDLLPLIRCPTLIIHGEKDPVVPSCHPHFLHKHIAGSRLHLMPEGKHNLHLRFPEEFNRVVEDFLGAEPKER
ncbi:valacyclovir hydrolase [Hippocampus comes]|uniref:Biphenyl hydrolase like n=1 Tax=Hippocampus comes TaxID=109280 RepID=A0A3Q3DA07_HIPCM|nr:PREDICTED: valacyclovir hydrolase [Hippocampus comes]